MSANTANPIHNFQAAPVSYTYDEMFADFRKAITLMERLCVAIEGLTASDLPAKVERIIDYMDPSAPVIVSYGDPA